MNGPNRSSRRRLDDAVSHSLTGLIFNASALALPYVAASLVLALSSNTLFDYSPTEANKRATAKAVNAEAHRFVQRSGDRTAEWSRLVLRELDEGDAAAARGFVLAAPSMLSGRETSKINNALTPGADDNEILLAAAGLLDETTQRRFRFAGRTGVEGSFDVLGDGREVANQAQRWLAGEPVDAFLFILSGATLALASPDLENDDVRLGGSVIKIGRTAARLPSTFTEVLETRLRDAAPEDRLREELSAAFQNTDSIVDEGAAATLAFSRAINRDAYRILAADLAEVGAIARATSPAGAVQLLRDVDTESDLLKLRLIAEASRERAVAVAKRSPERLIIKAARGSIRWSERLVRDLASLAIVLLGLLGSLAYATHKAVADQWQGGASASSRSRPVSKADAVRRARRASPKTAETVS